MRILASSREILRKRFLKCLETFRPSDRAIFSFLYHLALSLHQYYISLYLSPRRPDICPLLRRYCILRECLEPPFPSRSLLITFPRRARILFQMKRAMLAYDFVRKQKNLGRGDDSVARFVKYQLRSLRLQLKFKNYASSRPLCMRREKSPQMRRVNILTAGRIPANGDAKCGPEVTAILLEISLELDSTSTSVFYTRNPSKRSVEEGGR